MCFFFNNSYIVKAKQNITKRQGRVGWGALKEVPGDRNQGLVYAT
jgi:hypothetical protein